MSVISEATSSLETESEAPIREVLAGLFGERTAIAHRRSRLAALDRIVVPDRQRVIEAITPVQSSRYHGDDSSIDAGQVDVVDRITA